MAPAVVGRILLANTRANNIPEISEGERRVAKYLFAIFVDFIGEFKLQRKPPKRKMVPGASLK
jgi:hypothetical protein